MEMFEFITTGMASMFMHDQKFYRNNPDHMLYKVVTELYSIKNTLFDMNINDHDASYY